MQSFASHYQHFVPFSLCAEPPPPPQEKSEKGRLLATEIIPIQTPTFPQGRGISTQATSIFKDVKRNSGLDIPV